MSLEDIPECPPHPKIHSIHLYRLPDAFLLAQKSNQNSLLTPDIGTDAGLHSPFIPECGPIPLRHGIALYSSSEVTEPIPDINVGSQPISIALNPKEPDIGISNSQKGHTDGTQVISTNSQPMSSREQHQGRSPSLTPLSHSIPLPDVITPKLENVALPKETSPSSDHASSSKLVTAADAPIQIPEQRRNYRSSSRGRSQSPTRRLIGENLGSSWWGGKHVARPWHDTPKKKKTIPPEQTEALEGTRRRVALAVGSVLDTAADVVHESLYIGVELAHYVPIPGLRTIALAVLDIWDAAQNVDMNRLACLRLTERCADILLSVREEVHEAGDEIGIELDALAKLTVTYEDIYRFMHKQTTRPWLKRYLKRDEIVRDIAAYNTMLRDALALFGISIQVRLLKQLQQEGQYVKSDFDMTISGRETPSSARMIMDTELQSSSPEINPFSPYTISTDYSSETVTKLSTQQNALGLIDNYHTLPPLELGDSHILPMLETIQTIQNSFDTARDKTDLRQLMLTALQATNDAEMLEVFQIGRKEMPDAIKTLQRALERVSEQEREALYSSFPGSEVSITNVEQKIEVKESQGNSGIVKRSETIASTTSNNSTLNESQDFGKRDILDCEFIETGIDALKRTSRDIMVSVPSWTITKYEVDRDKKIGYGFFSDVYKGTWRGWTVAIKVLAKSTPRNLFIREIEIWKSLHHTNLLPCFGASSATGDPPWFFVSPYMKNGTLVEYLRRSELEERPTGLGLDSSLTPIPSFAQGTVLPNKASEFHSSKSSSPPVNPQMSLAGRPAVGSESPRSEVRREWDLFRFMHEIARGMEYLHSNGVLHGDLKGSNVLIDSKLRCVVSDFGQSEMKSEAIRLSGVANPPQGALRWQAPEIMNGLSQLTMDADVWAFSITCVEILTMGRLPWQLMDDDSVRHFVLKENSRPPLPKNSRFNTPQLQEILRGCWQTKPELRPSFARIARDLRLLRKGFVDSPRLPAVVDEPKPLRYPSPDMYLSSELSYYLQKATVEDDVLDTLLLTDMYWPEIPPQESTVGTVGEVNTPESIFFTPGSSPRISSIMDASVYSLEGDKKADNYYGFDIEAKNERRYRLNLVHNYHPSLVLPLWEPSQVELGAVGYLSKPTGNFVTLFNANRPNKASDPRLQSLPRINGYGDVKEGVLHLPQKTVTQRVIDKLTGTLTFKNSSELIAKRQSFPLKPGHMAAHLYAEATEYKYMETLEAPKKWFELHADTIMDIFGPKHRIQKEDLYLIIGTLSTQDYALLLSRYHLEGHAYFNVYSNPQTGHPWGTFTTDTEIQEAVEIRHALTSKVSDYGDPWQTVLLARLRFKPDITEPTST